MGRWKSARTRSRSLQRRTSGVWTHVSVVARLIIKPKSLSPHSCMERSTVAFEIDIKTRAFRDSETIYRLFPGKGYRYFNVMRDNSAVFLDMPGIPFPEEGGYPKTTDTLQEMAKADERAPKVWNSLRRKDYVEAIYELRKDLSEIDDSSPSRYSWSKRASMYHGWMNLLYSNMRIGDVVMIPSSQINRNVLEHRIPPSLLIGTIKSSARRLTSHSDERINAASFLSRPVSWIVEMEERDVANFISPSIRTSNVVVGLNARFLHQVISSAYLNVNIGNEYLSRFTTKSAEFMAYRNYHFSAFAMAVSAAYQAAVEGNRIRSDRSIYELAASVNPDVAVIPIQDVLIRSPGHTTLRHATNVTLIVSALFALAGQATEEYRPEDLRNLLVVNSEPTREDICDPIKSHIDDAIRLLGYERWQQLCRAKVLASENDGLSSATAVRLVE